MALVPLVAVRGGTWLPTVHSMALSGSGWLAMHAAARALGVQWRVGTRRYSAVLGVARGWARARAVVLMSVGGIWRSAALGSTQRCARARWHESWHSATLCSARWSSAAAVERGGRRQAASRSDTARRRSAALCSARWHSAALGGSGGMRQAASRGDTAWWRSVARRCVHLVALGSIRWRSAAGVGLRGRFGASQVGWLALAALQRRSALDQCWLAWLAAQHTAAPGRAR